MQLTVHVIANWANVRLRVQDFELAQIVSENQTKKIPRYAQFYISWDKWTLLSSLMRPNLSAM